MVRYFYAWTPLVIVGTAVLLAAPWLALIALMILPVLALVALAALAWAIVSVPYSIGRAIGRRVQQRSGAHPRTAPVSWPAWRSLRVPVVQISLKGVKR